MMKVLALLLGVLFAQSILPALAADAERARGPAPAAGQLDPEAARLLREGDRILAESKRLRAEAQRLIHSSQQLRESAAVLDQRWVRATTFNPVVYREFAGRNRSQLRMRADSSLMSTDAAALRREADGLQKEAVRLWKLAAAVDPDAQLDLLRRLRECCRLAQVDTPTRATMVRANAKAR